MPQIPLPQIPLPLSLAPSYKSDGFVRGEANTDALEWLSIWPDWPLPQRGLNIFGPPGSGKTHLSYLFQERSAAARFNSLTDMNAIHNDHPSHVILDDFDKDGAYIHEAVFHLFNYLAENSGSVLILSKQPVARFLSSLPDLTSRLRAIAAQEIHLPDDKLLHAVMSEMFSDRQCLVAENIIDYIIQRMDRQFSSAQQLVQKIDLATLASSKPVSLGLVKSVLEANGQNDVKITPE